MILKAPWKILGLEPFAVDKIWPNLDPDVTGSWIELTEPTAFEPR